MKTRTTQTTIPGQYIQAGETVRFSLDGKIITGRALNSGASTITVIYDAPQPGGSQTADVHASKLEKAGAGR